MYALLSKVLLVFTLLLIHFNKHLLAFIKQLCIQYYQLFNCLLMTHVDENTQHEAVARMFVELA
jgi:hypothetical protein